MTVESVRIPHPLRDRPLAGDLHRPPVGTDVCGAVLVIHGFKGFKDWGFFPYSCERLARAGLVALRFNMSGCGILAGGEGFDDPEGFETNTYGKELEDVRVALSFLEQRARMEGGAQGAGPERIGMLGHSRGGGMAVVTAAEDARVASLVTWAAISDPDRFGAEAASAWDRGETVPVINARTGQVFRMRRHFLDDLRAQHARLDLAARAREIRAPWLIVQGARDETVLPNEARALLAAAPDGDRAATRELLMIEGPGHTLDAVHPFAGPTEALDRALDATIAWFARTLGGR
jgi:dienelactone hydrolase